jgi:hypothetical protein
MNSYRNAEIEYRERCKARIQRQLEISENKILNIVSSYCVVYSLYLIVAFVSMLFCVLLVICFNTSIS